MSSRLIEKCLEIEDLGESYYTWIKTSKRTALIIVDPYIINLDDLRNIKQCQTRVVRLRRPGWGRGNISNYIHYIEIN